MDEEVERLNSQTQQAWPVILTDGGKAGSGGWMVVRVCCCLEFDALGRADPVSQRRQTGLGNKDSVAEEWRGSRPNIHVMY